MSGFLNKFRVTQDHNRPAQEWEQKLPLRDPNDPRILYKNSDRAKRISLRVNPTEREVIVTVPGQRALKKAMSFAREQKQWIDVQLEALPPAQPFIPGTGVLFNGEIYTLTRPSARGRPTINHETREIIVPSPEDTFSGRVRRFLIREARKALENSTHHYAEKLGREVEKISIRDTRSRWGSCITRRGKGHISYSWRLISAPSFVLDYVAAHECAHMIEANHSPAYWAVVEQIFPEYKKAKQWLRKNGGFLHAVGAEF